MLIVADTNVLVSGILWPRGLPGQLIALVTHGSVSLAVSPRLLEEIERVLDQPKLTRFVAGDSGCREKSRRSDSF
jgi:putative PIN family toxin of toxin-antitoxin system